MTRIVAVVAFAIGAFLDATYVLAQTSTEPGVVPRFASPAPTASASPVALASPNATPDYDAYRALVAHTPDMTFTVDLDEYVDGRQYHVREMDEYESPHLARCEIIDDGTEPERSSRVGSRTVWRDGSKVQAFRADAAGTRLFVLDRTNPRITDALGFGCGAWAPSEAIRLWNDGTRFESDGPTIDGLATRRDVFVPSLAARTGVYDVMSLDIDRATHLPVRFSAYAAGLVVGVATYCDFRLDVGLSRDRFTLTERFVPEPDGTIPTAPPSHAPVLARGRRCPPIAEAP